MPAVLDTLKSVARAAWSYQYNRSNAKWVSSILNAHEQEGSSFPKKMKDLCDDYAVEMLGAIKYAPWLYLYTHVSGSFKEGWIPDNFYGERVVGHTSGPYGEVSDLRALNYRLFAAEEFPDVGAHINGVFVDRDGSTVPGDKVMSVIFSEGDRVVYKLDQSLQGTGIHFFDRDEIDLDRLRKLGNGTFQSFIRQHEDFNAFSDRSVATVRLTTAVSDAGEVSLRAGYLRLGRGQDTHVQSASHVRIPIELDTGALDERGYLPNWLKISAHPDTGVEFKSKIIPSYAQCVKVVTSCHRRMPYVRCIGWDLSVDVAGKVKIIEWNGGHNDIKFGESTQGPCFKDLNWERFR